MDIARGTDGNWEERSQLATVSDLCVGRAQVGGYRRMRKNKTTAFPSKFPGAPDVRHHSDGSQEYGPYGGDAA